MDCLQQTSRCYSKIATQRINRSKHYWRSRTPTTTPSMGSSALIRHSCTTRRRTISSLECLQHEDFHGLVRKRHTAY